MVRSNRRATVGLVCLVCSTRWTHVGGPIQHVKLEMGTSGPSARLRTLIGGSV